jgi:hypothetical protein
MKSCIVTICTSASANLAITIRARKACIQNYFLETLAIPALEITYKGVVSLAVWESVHVKFNIR